MLFTVLYCSLYFLLQEALGVDGASSSSAAAPTLVETGLGSTVATHVVTVGKTLNAFEPNSIIAAKGDILQEFQFFPPNHSVGRAEYGQPCIPYEDRGENKIGFWSGFYPVDKILDNPPKWNLTINDTEPVFLYCAAPGSCINYQMVGVINPNSSVSLAKQKRDAADSQYMLAPGRPFPSEGGVPTGDVDPTTPSTASTSSSMTMSPTPISSASSMPGINVDTSSNSRQLSNGAIAGIVIAGVVVLALFAALVFLLGRHTTLIKSMRRNHWPQPGIQNPPGNQNIGSPPPQMTAFPHQHRPGSPYSDVPTFHDQAYNSPPYTEHPSYGLPPNSTMAELSTGEKKSQEYVAGDTTNQQHGGDTPPPAPTSKSRPFSLWGSSRSAKTQYV
ncbi:hypothetical protein ACLMJK_008292 [Lecanora helva]